MTQEEILQYNKMCAELLGWNKTHPKIKDWHIYITPIGYVSYDKMLFDSDWNWIMEVVEAIEKLGYATKIDHDYCMSDYGCDRCEIDTEENALYVDYEDSDDRNIEEPIAFELTKSKKEAVVETINTFLIWHNENK